MQSPYPSTALDAARRAIVEQLREIRRDAGLTGREVAARTGWLPSKVSRLQSATTPPSDDDIRAWCRACNAEDRIPDLLAANRTAESMYLEWRRVQRTGLWRLQESRMTSLTRQPPESSAPTSSAREGILSGSSWRSPSSATLWGKVTMALYR
jgi:transcriptional regulator with XRE-family HTH domain